MSAEADQIIAALRADERRDIYQADPRYYYDGRSPEFFVTYKGGGPFSMSTVLEMVTAGTLIQKYPNCHCYKLANKQ